MDTMDNLHLSVIAVVLYLNLPGSVGTEARRILLDTHHSSECRWDGELSLNCSSTGISAVPEGAARTAGTADLSYNNIKTFTCTEERNGQWKLKHLNLSNNVISELSFATCRNLPVLETLNLNGNAIRTLTLDVPAPAHGSETDGQSCCLLPALKVLSVERNHLHAVPRGLGLLQALETVHLSSNSIRQIGLDDFRNCSQLKDIHLQHNKITQIQPDAFRDLNKLQVVDLRENALTTPLPQVLMGLNFFQLEVDLSNNAWQFTCGLNAFKHFFHIFFDSTMRKLSISYNTSANNSQKPQLYLSSFNLNCSDSVLLKRAVIPTGETSVLNCDLDNTGGNGASWWAPEGRITKDSHLPHITLDKMNNIVIHDAEKTAEGLYLCIFNTTKKKHLLYNVQVKDSGSTFLVRKARDTSSLLRQGRTEQDLVLAVCLSVLITFVCAFCLGAFARPYLVSLWRRMRRSKHPSSEHTYSNQAFSDETWSGECFAGRPANTGPSLFMSGENPSRNRSVFPAETSAVCGNGTDSSARAPSRAGQHQEESNAEMDVKSKPGFSDIETGINSYENINVGDGLVSVRTDWENSSVETPRKLTRNGISLWEDPKHVYNKDSEKSRFPAAPRRPHSDSSSDHTDSSDSDSSFSGEKGFPFSTARTRMVARDSRNSQVSNNSGSWPETTKAPPASPGRGSIAPHNKPTSITNCTPGSQSCDEQLGPNGHVNVTSDVGGFILPGSCKGDTNTENLSIYQTRENAPLGDYGCETDRTNQRDAPADIFGDSSSSEGTPFTMSDCSSLADFELEQPDVSDNTPVCQSPLEESDTNSGREKFSALPESPNVAAELWHIGKNEDENRGYFETTITYRSDTITPEAASPDVDKGTDRVSTSEPDTVSSSSQEVPDSFDYFPNKELTVTYSDSESLHNQNTDFGEQLLSLKHSPMYDTDTESASEEGEPQGSQQNTDFGEQLLSLKHSPMYDTDTGSASEEGEPQGSQQNTDFGEQLRSLKHSPVYDTDTESASEEGEPQCSQLPVEPQRSLRQSPAEQEENAAEGSSDEHYDSSSSRKNRGEEDITLRRSTSPSEYEEFIFAPIGAGLNDIVKTPSLLRSSNELSLWSLPEHATDKQFMVTAEQDDLLPWGMQVDVTKACADQMQRGFDEEDSDDSTELQDTGNCGLPKETRSHKATADLLRLHSSGKTQSAFSTDHVQLGQSDEDTRSSSVPQGFSSESRRHSSRWSQPKTTGNTTSESSDSSEAEGDALTGLENCSTTPGNLQRSSEKLSQKSQPNLGQGQYFVKKKRAFDGFSKVLQSRRTDFNS